MVSSLDADRLRDGDDGDVSDDSSVSDTMK